MLKLTSLISQWSLRLISDLSGNMLKMKYFKKLVSSHLEQRLWRPHFCPWQSPTSPGMPCSSLMIPGSLPGLWVANRGHHLLCSWGPEHLPDGLLNCSLMLKLGMTFFSLFLLRIHPTKLVVCSTGSRVILTNFLASLLPRETIKNFPGSWKFRESFWF